MSLPGKQEVRMTRHTERYRPSATSQTGTPPTLVGTVVTLYPYPLSRQKLGVFKVDSSPCVKAVGTEGARRATGVPTATPYTSAGVR